MLVLLAEGIYELAIEMGSGTLVYMSSFIKFGSPIQKIIGGDTHTDTQTAR
jgi:putative component of toxin-antitoxin plasmid stabilization module